MKYDRAVEKFRWMVVIYNNCPYFFTVFEFSKNAEVITSCDALWETASRLDVRLQRALQQLVHFSVVVIIVPVKTKTRFSETFGFQIIFQNNSENILMFCFFDPIK
jgi:glycopeptide antibiotics resistance protein